MVSTPTPWFLLVLIVILTWRMEESPHGHDPLTGNSMRLCDRKSWPTDESFPCRCHSDTIHGYRLIVVCSGLGLRAVPPDIPHSTVELYLNNNTIRQIPGDVFGMLHRLEILDLSENMIDSIDRNAFTGLMSLRKLHINNNNLDISKGMLPAEVFSPLLHLTQLDLNSNIMGYYNKFEYPDNCLGQLRSLEILHIDGVSNKTFGRGLKNLTYLESLDLSGTPKFQYVSRGMFGAFYDIPLQFLNLSRCDMRWIHPEAFSSLPKIDTIDLSYNVMLELRNAASSAYGLRNTTIRKLNLQSIHSGPEFTRVTKDDAINVGRTRLKELYVDYNNIDQFEIDCISHLPVSLQVLSLSHNNIQTYTLEIYAMFLLRNLRVLNASFQMTYSNLKFDNWEFNRSLARLGQHNINNTDVETRKVRKFNLPKNLSVVSFSHTYKIKYPIHRLVLLNSHLKFVDFSYNQIQPWVGPIEGMETAIDFDLSGNDCEYVSPTFFAYATGLQRLYIGHNKLGPKLNDFTFYNLTNLEYLDLSDNRLEHVTSDLLYRLINIHYLNLSHNYIALWEARIVSLTKMSMLDLRSNKLSAPPLSLLEDLDVIKMSSNVTVTFIDNPLRCSCETEYFIQWLTDTRVLVSNLNKTTCLLYNGTLQSFSDRQAILDHLRDHCRSFTPVVAALSTTICLILCVIVGRILHRYRWKLRYLYYMAVKRGERTGYQTLDGVAENPFAFDAFLSYEESDRKFIKQHVLPKLERDGGLKLCIDRRDFTPGMYITENIMNAIQNSRKTVVLLSKEFLKSNWCMYEMNMARMESLYNGRETLVIVLMEALEARDLSAEVLEIFHSQSYIEKTDDPTGEDLFWRRLLAAIK